MVTRAAGAPSAETAASTPAPRAPTPADVVLDALSPRDAELLRKCAIPHQFNYRLLRVMEPLADRRELADAIKRMVKLRAAIRLPDGLALHDRIRAVLFDDWLKEDRLPELREISARLAEYFLKRLQLQGVAPARFDQGVRRWVYHLTLADEERGFDVYDDTLEYYRSHFLISAAENLHKMISEFETILTPEHRIFLVYDRGKLASDRGNHVVARKAYRDVILSEATSPLLQAKAYNRIGLTYDATRDWGLATEAFGRSLKLLPEGASEVPRVLRNIGVVHREVGNLDRAEEAFKASCKVAEQRGDSEAFAAARNALGTVYQLTGEYDQSMCCLQEALDLLPEHSFDRARVHNNIGIVAMDAQRWDESESHFMRSLEIKQSAMDTVGQAFTYMNLVRLYRVQGKTDAAISAASSAAAIFEELSDLYSAALSYLNLTRLYASLDSEKAREAGAKATAALRRANEEKEARLAEREIRALLETRKRRSPWLWVLLIPLTVVGFVVFMGVLFLVLLYIQQ
jgi:tetratricopeptide (TPR) repeat protein